MATRIVLDEASRLDVTGGAKKLQDGEIVNVPCRVYKLRSGGTALAPEGTFGIRVEGLRVDVEPVRRRR